MYFHIPVEPPFSAVRGNIDTFFFSYAEIYEWDLEIVSHFFLLLRLCPHDAKQLWEICYF